MKSGFGKTQTDNKHTHRHEYETQLNESMQKEQEPWHQVYREGHSYVPVLHARILIFAF